ncbi:MAG: hypothetical protein QM770_09140 [Tepidisphaeraceae bacterium]
MNSVYNPETEIYAQIERLELDARDIRRRVEHAPRPEDKRVLNQQLSEIMQQIDRLRERVGIRVRK